MNRVGTVQDSYFKCNNFDLIRLVAAAQVMVFHAIEHLEVHAGYFREVIAYLPGVPAFFLVSGFLISASWERNSDLRTYFVNRGLRIFPALWGLLAFTLVTLFIFYDRDLLVENGARLMLWAVCQATIFQDWNPDFLRGYGVGSVNGSLWTIPVELSFYVFIPLIYLAGRKAGSVQTVLIGIIVLSFGLQYGISIQHDQLPSIVARLIGLSPLPWVGMFCCGIMAQRHLDRIHALVAGRLPWFALAFCALALLSWYLPAYPLLRGTSNSMGIINYAALSLMILSAAYTRPDLAEKVLQRNDISYGVYIFHMPVINVFLQNRIMGWPGFACAITLAVGFAGLSWILVEKPALGLRHWALYKR